MTLMGKEERDMLFEENDLTIIGIIMIIIGVCILIVPLLNIKKPEEYRISLALVSQIGELVFNGKIVVITGLLWIICGFIIQLVTYI